MERMGRRGKEEQVEARQRKASRGAARQAWWGRDGRGGARHGMDRQGFAGMVGQRGERHDRAWSGKAWQGRRGEARRGAAWFGVAGRGMAYFHNKQEERK